MYEIIIESDASDLKYLFKIPFLELKEGVPAFLKFFVFMISLWVCKAVCETLASVIDVVGKHRVRSKEGTDEVETKDKTVLIPLNALSSGYKATRRFLKAALLPLYNSTYPFHFRNPTRSEMMKRFVTWKL